MVETATATVSDVVYSQFCDVQGWLAHLYKFCLANRKHLKTKSGLDAVEALRADLPAGFYVNDLEMWHVWLLTFMLAFNEMRWKGVDLASTPPPKMKDYVLLGLMKHEIFNNKSIDEIIKTSFKLTSAERRVLKELAIRLS